MHLISEVLSNISEGAVFEKIIRDWLMIWVTIEPIGTLALFAVITSGLSPRERRKTAMKATVYSAIILLGAIVSGQIILAALNIKLISFQLAGGVILFLFGLQMIFGLASGVSHKPEVGHDIAVFPLAVPSIVDPAAIIAVILLTDNHLYSVPMQAVTAVVMLTVLAITYVLMVLAGPILRIIGKNGTAILERIMGMILTAISVELVMSALGIDRWTIPKS